MNDTLKIDAERFAAFIQAHYPNAQSWKDPVGYVAWYISHMFTAAVCDEETKEIMAVGAARPVERPGMGVIPCYYNRGGTCLHIDLLVDISPDLRAIIAFREICRMRFPQCRVVTMFRHYETNLRVYEINKFWKNLERIKKSRMKKEKQYAR